MTVEEFNPDKGIYIFEFDDLDTEFHSHPTVEILVANNGTFTLGTETETHPTLKVAIIAANQKHKISATGCTLRIVMLEHHNRLVSEQLAQSGIMLKNGYYLTTTHNEEAAVIANMVQSIKNGLAVTEYDNRISEVISYLNKNDLAYEPMIKTLQEITNLSESRLSHLFKSNIGISLKRYRIWAQLKSTIRQHIDSQQGLLPSLIDRGFYDQPHFSRTFKSMLGVKPSKAYNSRMIQALPAASS